MNHWFEEMVIESREVVIQGLNYSSFEKLNAEFRDLRIEFIANEKVILKSPLAGFEGLWAGKIEFQLAEWSMKNKVGKMFSPNTGYLLPDGSVRTSSASWLSDDSFTTLAKDFKGKGFLPITPDFLIEMSSKTDRFTNLKTKMSKTWIANGVKLAWLIDPYREKSYIYRPDGTVETIEGFDKKLSDEALLPGFELELSELKLIDGQ